MRKSLLFMLLFLGSLTCFAQTYHEDDKEGLRNFLRQPSAVEDKCNFEIFELTASDTIQWHTSEEWIRKIEDYNLFYNPFEWTENEGEPKHLKKLLLKSRYTQYDPPYNLSKRLTLEANIDLNYFSKLEKFEVYYQRMKVIDVSKNANIKEIHIEHSGTNELKVSDININLSDIVLDHCSLKNMDISSLSNLETLSLDYNYFERIDLSKNEKLKNFSCTWNKLVSLNLSKNTDLTRVDVSYNNIRELYLPKSITLQTLYCDHNSMKLSTLPIPYYDLQTWSYTTQQIEEESVAPNTELDLSSEAIINGKNSSFQWVDKDNKDITAQITNKGNGIFVIGSEFLDQTLTCKIKNETFPQLEMSHIFKVEEVFQIYGERDKEGLRKLLRQPAYKEGRFNFEYFGLTATDTLQWHSSEKWVEKINLYISGQEPFYWEKGEDGYMHLVDIDFSGPPRNSLELGVLSGELDFSYFSELAYVNCNLQRFTSVDLSQNSKLITLDLSINLLKEIDLSNNTKLEVLILNSNKIENINLSNNPLIDWLDVSNNQISSLNLQKNKDLIRLFATNNQLTGVDISESTKLSKLDISKNELTGVDISKNTELTFVNASFNKLTEVDMSANTELTDANLSYNKLTQLDVSKNVALRYLDVSVNFLRELDLSNNLQLYNIDAHSNILSKINIIENANLKYVTIFANAFKLSTLPLFKGTYGVTLLCTFQDQVEEGDIKVGQEIDLSSESVVGGINSTFRWESEMGEDITSQIENKGNGKFLIGKEFVNHFLICIIKNQSFPSLAIPHVFNVIDMTTGIEEGKPTETGIKIYSNPVADVLYLESDEEIKATTLFDISGRTLKTNSGNVKQINVGDLPEGFYYLKTTTQSGKQSTHKIKKQ